MPFGVDDAGLVLAGVSLTFEIFSGCIKGFQLLSASQQVGQDCEILLCWLRLEQYRLMTWANKSGLADDNLDRRFDEALIQSTLGELRTVLGDVDKMKKRYKLDVRLGDIPPGSAVGKSLSANALRFLDTDAIRREQERILRRARLEQKSISFPKRLWFAAVDRNGFEELIKHVSTLIQRLFDLLDIKIQENTQESLRLMHLSLFNIVDKLDDLKIMTNQVQQAVVPDETLRTVAALRKLQIDLNDTTTSMTPIIQAPVMYQRLLTQVKDATAGLGGSTAFYEGTPVYIEWKHYSSQDVSGANAVKIMARARELSSLLHVPKAPLFRSLRCRGYFQDSRRSAYCFIYDRPAVSQVNILPHSLLTLLKSKHMPSITQRVQLALDLAITIMHLHASGWIHKNLRSDNILFFPTAENAPQSLLDPFVMGYEYARNDSRPELSEKPSENPLHDVYRHPFAHGPVSAQYRKSFDVYSLGILFVEIAYWHPIGKLLERAMGLRTTKITPASMNHIRQRMIDEQGTDQFPQALRFRIGDEYTKATLCCLGEVFDDPQMSSQEFITSFYELIVRRLQNCKI